MVDESCWCCVVGVAKMLLPASSPVAGDVVPSVEFPWRESSTGTSKDSVVLTFSALKEIEDVEIRGS